VKRSVGDGSSRAPAIEPGPDSPSRRWLSELEQTRSRWSSAIRAPPAFCSAPACLASTSPNSRARSPACRSRQPRLARSAWGRAPGMTRTSSSASVPSGRNQPHATRHTNRGWARKPRLSGRGLGEVFRPPADRRPHPGQGRQVPQPTAGALRAAKRALQTRPSRLRAMLAEGPQQERWLTGSSDFTKSSRVVPE